MTVALERMKVQSVRFARGAENVKQQYAQAGQSIDDKQIMSMIIFPHVGPALEQLQNDLFEVIR